MYLKASYILVSVVSLGLMLFEAPRGNLLTGAPDRGKVEPKDPTSSNSSHNPTVRSHYFVFIGGYHGGK